jgi:hypothetical protein
MMKRKLATIVALVILSSLIGMAQSEPEQLIGEGTIVAFQKYDRHREKPYQRGMGTFVEEWIVRIDRWESGTKSLGYFLVTYEKVSQRALSDEEMNRPKWRFAFREPIFHEAESCAGNAPVPSKDGTSHQSRPAAMKDFQRTKAGMSDLIPPLKELPCLIANEPPTEVKAHGEKPTTPTTR